MSKPTLLRQIAVITVQEFSVCIVDWLIVNSVAIRQGCIGTIRYILKDSLKYIPIYGYYFEQHGCIYVKRRAAQDQVKMARSPMFVCWLFWPSQIVIFPQIIANNSGSENARQLELYEASYGASLAILCV
jgi:1-acyl-sn-glycerol-3-phosphate acyltransferase